MLKINGTDVTMSRGDTYCIRFTLKNLAEALGGEEIIPEGLFVVCTCRDKQKITIDNRDDRIWQVAGMVNPENCVATIEINGTQTRQMAAGEYRWDAALYLPDDCEHNERKFAIKHLFAMSKFTILDVASDVDELGILIRDGEYPKSEEEIKNAILAGS